MAKKTQGKEETILNVQEVYSKTELFFEKNRKQLTIGLGAIALAFATFFGYQYLYKKPKEVEASNKMFVPESWAEMDSLEWAVNGNGETEGMLAIAEQYSGTKVGMRANYWCGVYYRNKAQYSEAINHFKKADFDDNAVGITAIGNVGDMYVMENNLEEGAEWLEKAAKKASSSDAKDYLYPFYALKAAKVQLELNKDDRAKTLLNEIVKNYDKKSAEYGEAEKLLAYVKAKA